MNHIILVLLVHWLPVCAQFKGVTLVYKAFNDLRVKYLKECLPWYCICRPVPEGSIQLIHLASRSTHKDFHSDTSSSTTRLAWVGCDSPQNSALGQRGGDLAIRQAKMIFLVLRWIPPLGLTEEVFLMVLPTSVAVKREHNAELSLSGCPIFLELSPRQWCIGCLPR